MPAVRLCSSLVLVAILATPAVAQDSPACSGEAVSHFQTAAQAWGAGRRDDATVWLYVAQLRGRACLQAFPDQPPDGAPALFGSLMETVGRPINEYAFGDIPRLVRGMNRALAWDTANPDRSIPAAIKRKTRAGLQALREDTVKRADEIRRERTRNGLPNR